VKFTRYLYLDIDELFLPRSVAPERQLHISMTSFASQPARTTVLFWVKDVIGFHQFRLYKGKVASQARWKATACHASRLRTSAISRPATLTSWREVGLSILFAVVHIVRILGFVKIRQWIKTLYSLEQSEQHASPAPVGH